MRHFQGSITHFTCLLTKDRTQQTLLSSQLRLALRCYFSDQDITGADLCSDTDNTALIQILKRVLTDTRYIACDLLGSVLLPRIPQYGQMYIRHPVPDARSAERHPHSCNLPRS